MSTVLLSGAPRLPKIPAQQQPPSVGVTFTRKGYGRLLRADGAVVSQHIVAEEAYERAAMEGSGTYRWVPAQIEIKVP